MTTKTKRQPASERRRYACNYEVLASNETPSDEDRKLPEMSFTCQSAKSACEAAELSMIGRVAEGSHLGNTMIMRVRKESVGPPVYGRGPWSYVEVSWHCKARQIDPSEVPSDFGQPGPSLPCQSYKVYPDTPGYCEYCGHAEEDHQ
jgi:hypothetical protein